MNEIGFRLRKLVVSGGAKGPAQVDFEAGLNVITGASNTGKTYIFQCLDFMFGADKAPKPLEESAGYKRIALEISSPNGIWTLERAMEGGDFQLAEGGIADEGKANRKVLELRDRHDKKNADNISSFLLQASGFNAAKLRKNADNELVDLSFRTINQLFVVDETTIIQERSPLLKQLGYSDTQQKSAFNFILTGKDDSAVISKARNEETEREMRVKQEVLASLVRELEERVKERASAVQDTASVARNLEERLVSASAGIAQTQSDIARLQKEIGSKWRSLGEHESTLAVKRGLLQRFSLLLRHYETDLARLEAISEAQHYFQQLQPVACPLCGSAIERHSAEASCSDQDWAAIASAAAAEAKKISVLKTDLEKTMTVLSEEERGLISGISERKKSIGDLQAALVHEQAPILSANEKEMRELLALKHQLDEITSLKEQVSEMTRRRDAVMADIAASEKKAKPAARTESSAQAALCDVMAETLRAWKFKFKGEIHFDLKSADFIIGGKARQSNGKGIRALLHAAFVVALMRYCRQKKLPHPGLLILDSPLTTLKEGVSAGDAEEIPQEVQDAFFVDLAQKHSAEQIVVIENKEPPREVRSRINYLAFTGGSRPGRAGFFPVTKKRS